MHIKKAEPEFCDKSCFSKILQEIWLTLLCFTGNQEEEKIADPVTCGTMHTNIFLGHGYEYAKQAEAGVVSS